LFKKANFFFITLLFLLGFFPIMQVLGQTPSVITIDLEFSRSGWSTSTPRDYTLGGSLLEGDFAMFNLTISSSGNNVTISEKTGISQNRNQIDVGEVSEDFYLDYPFFIYHSNQGTTAQWWFYWINASVLDPQTQFALLLEQGGTPFLDSLFYQEGNWVGNVTLLTYSPLTMGVTQLADRWILSGFDNYSIADNYLVNRSLSLSYDMDGYLLLLEGDTCIIQGIYFYKYHFSWCRESIMTFTIPLESNPTSASSSDNVSILIFVPLLGLGLLTSLSDKHKENKS
jgi:hypothetical protein